MNILLRFENRSNERICDNTDTGNILYRYSFNSIGTGKLKDVLGLVLFGCEHVPVVYLTFITNYLKGTLA